MPLPVCKPTAFVVIAMVFLAPGTPVFAAGYYGNGVYFDADLAARYESNLSRASASADREEDIVTAFSAGGGYMKNLDDNSQLLISAYLAHERFTEFSDLNNIAVNTAIVYTVQPNTAYTAPWYRISAQVARRQYNESNIRDSYMLGAGAGVGKRFTDRVTAELDYHYERRLSDADVFDTGRHDLSTRLLYTYSRNISLFATYTLQVGEVVSTATPNIRIRDAALSIAPDDVFSPGLGPACQNRRCAYRLDAVGHSLETGMDINLNQLLSLNLSGRYFIVDGEGVKAYRGWLYQAGLYMQF